MHKKTSSFILRLLISSCSLGALSQYAYTSSFQIFEQSAVETGIAYSGMATSIDTSAAFYNPAGMVYIDAPEISGGISYASIKIAFANQFVEFSSDINQFVALPSPSFTGNTQNLAPNFHYVSPIMGLPNNVTMGLSITSPFALETNYQNSTISGYATDTFLQTININPSIAFNITETLSVGIGVNAQQLSTDFLAVAGFIFYGFPQRYTLDGWSYSWNIGSMFEVIPGTYLGASYRPKIEHHISGKMRATTLGSSGDSSSAFPIVTSDSRTQLNLPATTNLGVRSNITEDITITFDASYTQWNVFQVIDLQIQQPVDIFGTTFGFTIPTDLITNFYFKNTWFFGLGGTFAFNDQWTLKGGVAYDQTPTTNEFRELRIPDADRYQLALGIRYQANENLSIDAGYQHFFLPTHAEINNNPLLAVPNVFSSPAPFLQGHIESSANIGAVQFTWSFS